MSDPKLRRVRVEFSHDTIVEVPEGTRSSEIIEKAAKQALEEIRREDFTLSSRDVIDVHALKD